MIIFITFIYVVVASDFSYGNWEDLENPIVENPLDEEGNVYVIVYDE